MKAVLAALGLAAALLVAAPGAIAAKVAFDVQVPAKAWKAVRLRGLTKGASLAIRVQSDGAMNILLVHETELARFPKPVRPTFAGSLDRTLAFRVKVPVAGSYYVILDNRKGTVERATKLLIEALRAPSRPRKQPAQPQPGIKGI